ncbi:MAG: hypothetical protein NTZ03_06650 [Actinobacteria bacterium]|nr:hypothetical protein [Actinomycetota bacterium]
MNSRRLASIVGAAASVAAMGVLVAGPALATAATSVSATTPTWASSVLKGGGSFKSAATVSATYSVTMQLVRTASSTKPACTPAANCNTAGTVLTTSTGSYIVAKGAAQTVTALTWNCASQTTTSRYYWTWLKVADASGNAVTSLSLGLSGKYC